MEGTKRKNEGRRKEEGKKKEGERIEEPPLLVNPRTIRQLIREADFTLRDRSSPSRTIISSPIPEPKWGPWLLRKLNQFFLI